MPQLIALAIVSVGVWAGIRWFKREPARGVKELKRTRNEDTVRNWDTQNSLPRLKLDPETGIYRPSKG